MLNRFRDKLSYANVMATIALFVALGGTTWALTRNEVKSKHIAPDAARGSDVKESSLKGVGLTSVAHDEAITDGQPLALAVPGFPSILVGCSDNETPGVLDDDEVNVMVSNTTVQDFRLAATTAETTGEVDANVPVVDRILGASTGQPILSSGTDTVHSTISLQALEGQGSLLVVASAHENNSNALCSAQIQAIRLH